MKRLIIFSLLIIMVISVISAQSVESEIQKLTHYAEEYEAGNIDYVQLRVYISNVRERLNEIMGVDSREYGGIVKQEQLFSVLGEPSQYTRWIWNDREHRDIRIDEEVPAWEKIVFDGNKIQIKLNSWPFLFEKNEEISYNLHFNVEFKRKREQIDISGKLNEIAALAAAYSADPSSDNGIALAQKAVNVERTFEQSRKQMAGQCEAVMNSLMGAENRRDTQSLIMQEIDFFSGDDFEVIVRLELCDDCEWHWIGLDIWLESRGKFREPDERAEVNPEKFMSLDDERFKSTFRMLFDDAKDSLNRADTREFMRIKEEIWALNDAWNKKSGDVWKEVNRIFKERHNTMTDEQRNNYDWDGEEEERMEMARQMSDSNYLNRKNFFEDLFSEYEKSETLFTQIEWEKRLFEEFVEHGEEFCSNEKDDNNNNQTDCMDEQCAGKFCGSGEVEVKIGNETKIELRDMFCIDNICQASKMNETVRGAVCGNHICEGNETIENCAEDCAICPAHEKIPCNGKIMFGGKDENGCPLPPVCIGVNETCVEDFDCPQPLCGSSRCVDGQCIISEELIMCKPPECVDGEKKIIECKGGREIVKSYCENGIWIDMDNAVCPSTGKEICCEVRGVFPAAEPNYEWMPESKCISEAEVDGPDRRIVNENLCHEGIVIYEPVIKDECVVKEDCGGNNDVCSNGRCVPIPETIIYEEEKEFEEEMKIFFEKIEEEREEIKREIKEEVEKEIEGENNEKITGKIINGIKTITGAIITSFTSEDSNDTGNRGEPICPDVPISMWCSDCSVEEKGNDCLCPGTMDENGCFAWDCDSCERDSEECSHGEEKWEECGNGEMILRKYCDEKGYWIDTEYRCEGWNECEGDDCERECEPGEEKWEECGNGERVIRGYCDNYGDWIEKEDSCGEWEGDGGREGCEGDDCGWDECEGPDCGCQGEDCEKEEKEHPPEEKGVFKAGGVCRKSLQRGEAFVFFDGWGTFEDIHKYKRQFYERGEDEWCKSELENLIRQRKEFESGFNEEFVAWFFEDYLASSAEDWESHVSGIFDVYWSNVDNIMRTAHTLECLGKDEFPIYDLIDVKYDTEYGSLEYWEELKTASMPELGGKRITVVTPYMKVWLFPSKEFIKLEMKEAMKNHEFPGPAEEKAERGKEEGPTEEEKVYIRQNEKFMKMIREVSEKYGGSFDGAVQFVDYENKGDVAFNLYVQINENDIMKMIPMLPEEIVEKDVTVNIDFEKVYDLILSSEKDMRGAEIESPPWDRKPRMGIVKKVVNGAKMYFKVRGIISSAEVIPESAREDVMDLMKAVMKMMQDVDEEMGPPEFDEMEEDFEDVWESKESITGEAVSS